MATNISCISPVSILNVYDPPVKFNKDELSSKEKIPEVVRTFISEPLDPRGDLDLKEQALIELLVDPATYEGISPEEVNYIKKRILAVIDPAFSYSNPFSHRVMYHLLINGGSWVIKVVSFCLQKPTINFSHVVDGDRMGGAHFVVKSAFRKALLHPVENRQTGVMVARCSLFAKTKFSTFFPGWMKPEDLIPFFSKSSWTYKQGTKALYFYDSKRGSFPIEVYLRKQGAIIHSAYPIFGWIDLTKKQESHFMGINFTRDTIRNNLEKRHIQYETKEHLIVDIAKIYPIENLQRGLYALLSRAS